MSSTDRSGYGLVQLFQLTVVFCGIFSFIYAGYWWNLARTGDDSEAPVDTAFAVVLGLAGLTLISSVAIPFFVGRRRTKRDNSHP